MTTTKYKRILIWVDKVHYARLQELLGKGNVSREIRGMMKLLVKKLEQEKDE